MSRKVFISVLGTGNYKECIYCDDKVSFKSSGTRFIQKATLEYINAKQWSRNDTAIILLTKEARQKNWEDTDGKEGLFSELQRLNLPFRDNIVDLDIPEGRNEKEIWTIFSSIYENLSEGDELYFDLTHGFRYLPMLVLVLGNYSGFLKGTVINHISYGNWESHNSENEAPLVNLIPLSELQDWTFAAGKFIECGNADDIKGLTEKTLKSILKDPNTRTKSAESLRGSIGALSDFVSAIETCRGKSIIDAPKLNEFRNKLAEVKENAIEPLSPILSKVQDSLKDFNPGSIDNVFAATSWCLSKGMYQAATTILEEGFVTLICSTESIDIMEEDKRELINEAINIKFKGLTEDKWRAKEFNKVAMIKHLLNNPLIKEKDFCNKVTDFEGLRNDFNHSGMRKKKAPLDPDKIIKKIKDTIEFAKELKDKKSSTSTEPFSKLFINLSNQPSKFWSEKQISAAKEFGEIYDMEFPEIDPAMSNKKIDEKVDEYYHKILERANDCITTVHLMGEMAFSYKLTKRLIDCGIRVVASTTQRVSEDGKDGTTISKFEFVNFRDYQ